MATAFGDWPTYDQNQPRDGSQGLERTLSPSNASLLTNLFNVTTTGRPEGSVAVVNAAHGTARAYFGDWAGDLYSINATNGVTNWTDVPNGTVFPANHGTANCSYGGRGFKDSYPVDGITSTPAIWGTNLYVASQQYLYDLNPSTGSLRWKVNLAYLGSQPSGGDGYWQAHYVWSSPLVYNNSVYVGMSSGCDTPLVRGQFFQIPMNGTNFSGMPVHFFNVTSSSSLGGSLWSSPSINAAQHTVWISTGNGNTNPRAGGSVYNQAIVALDTSNVSKVRGYFTDLNQCKLNDCDWGAGPTQFTSAAGTAMVGAMSKDGTFYAFNASAFVANGTGITNVTKPAWEKLINYRFSYAPAAFDGQNLYIAGGCITVGCSSYYGSIRSVSPGDGSLHWLKNTSGNNYIGAGVTVADGLVIDAGVHNSTSSQGSDLQVRNASSGAVLYSFNTSTFEMNAEPVVFDGRIYVTAAPYNFTGSGRLLVFGINLTAGLSTMLPYIPTTYSPNCPLINATAKPRGGMPSFNSTWSWGDNTSFSFGPNPTHAYCVTGIVTSKLTMLDAAGDSAVTRWSVNGHVLPCISGSFAVCWTVTATHCVPIFGPFFQGCFPAAYSPATSYFGAYAVNGTGALTWAWNFGDGSGIGSGEFPSHTYQSHGTYAVQMSVSDSDHHQLQETYQLTV